MLFLLHCSLAISCLSAYAYYPSVVVVVLVCIGAKYILLTTMRIAWLHTHNLLFALSSKIINLLQIILDKVINTLHSNVTVSATP